MYRLRAVSLNAFVFIVIYALCIAPFIEIHILDMPSFFIHLPINEQPGQKIVVRRRIMILLTGLVVLNKKIIK
jgi:hypothetical protein